MKTPEGDPVASNEWPPRWCVVCDALPYTPHVRDEGHTCELPMRVNPSLSRAKIKRIRARFDAMRGKAPLRVWQAVPPTLECSTRHGWRRWGACVKPVDHDGFHADYHGRTWGGNCDCACRCSASTVHGTCNLCKDGRHV